LIVASALRQVAPEDATAIATLRGSDLVGLHYDPLYVPTEWGVQAMWFDRSQNSRLVPAESVGHVDNAYVILAGDFVSSKRHRRRSSPHGRRRGLRPGKKNGLLFLQPVDLRGRIRRLALARQFVRTPKRS
jgi:hypothetical protein